MGDVMLHCPLCCKETFNSKHELVKHLTNVLSNLICPICNDKWSTVVHLIEHLSLDNCQQINSAHNSKNQTVTEGDEKVRDNLSVKNEQSNDIDVQDKVLEDPVSNNINKLHEDGTQVNKTYVEFLSEQLLKPCLQTQDLEKESDDRYVILTDKDSLLNTGSTVVTKQNNDGTVSLTVEEPKLESDDQTDTTVNEAQNNKEELYTCNTCGVSFSSVLEHIQTYHSDQEVMLEEPLEDSINDTPLEYETLDDEESVVSDKQAPRRMITDTGDIVVAPITVEPSPEAEEQQSLEKAQTVKAMIIPLQVTGEKIDKKEPTKRYIQIIKSCDSIEKESDLKNGPFHKVVVKEMQTTLGNKIKVYNCTACNIFVLSLREFEAHPCKQLKYTCPHCPVSYENSKSLCAHMKVHKAKPEVVNVESILSFECGICGTVFATSKSLKLHKRMHDPVKSRPIDPPVETIEGTVASEHKFTCSICFKVIPEDYRTIHQNFHSNSNTLNCDICNKKFHSKEYLNMHMSVHNVDKIVVGKQDKSLPYTCTYCSRKFARPHEKVKHERIHTGEKPHECEICGKAFRVSYCLTLHMRTHTGARPYACPHCGKRFKAHSVFNHHLLTHSEVRAYKCPYCPKAFKTSVQLAGHKNSHTKPFSCQQCNRPFASLYAVRVHTEIHSRQNNLKFSCSLCGASYARAFALRDHIKQVHKDAAADTLNEIKNEDWTMREGDCDVEEMPSLNKDLSHEITEMESNSSEMILP